MGVSVVTSRHVSRRTTLYIYKRPRARKLSSDAMYQPRASRLLVVEGSDTHLAPFACRVPESSAATSGDPVWKPGRRSLICRSSGVRWGTQKNARPE
jgi:hypothetical protein